MRSRTINCQKSPGEAALRAISGMMASEFLSPPPRGLSRCHLACFSVETAVVITDTARAQKPSARNFCFRCCCCGRCAAAIVSGALWRQSSFRCGNGTQPNRHAAPPPAVESLPGSWHPDILKRIRPLVNVGPRRANAGGSSSAVLGTQSVPPVPRLRREMVRWCPSWFRQ